jgi:murein DD-endopeptidase MepM/ murein hydrolase activator NlpD
MALLFQGLYPSLEIEAAGSIVLQPPFDGTYRLTSFFDHTDPDYTQDNEVTIYSGESVADCSPHCYEGHPGYDWDLSTGTPVLAAADGTVEDVVVSGTGYGNRVVIEHDNGYRTIYTHFRVNDPAHGAPAFNVVEGQQVEAGDVVGWSGSTGNSTGPHLHFGVYRGPCVAGNGDIYENNVTDPFGWRGPNSDPLLDFPLPDHGHTATCLWNGVPGDDISCADIIVEDDAAGWEQHSTWFESTAGNGSRQNWTYSWNQPDSWATWTPSLLHPGYYQIHAFIPKANSTTTNATYKIYWFWVPNVVYINQNNSHHFWASLGTCPLSAGDYVYLNDYTGEPQMQTQISADAMKFSADIVHLPDVRNSGGWTSLIVIRNNSTSSAQAGISYYNTSGDQVDYQVATIASNGTATHTPSSGFTGSAVVVASEDVSVVVANDNGSEAYAYLGIPSTPSTSGLGTGTEVYIPGYLHNYYGYSSTVYVQNTGAAATTIHAYFYNDSGSQVDHRTANVNASGQTTFSLSGAAIGSVRLTAGQPVAAVVFYDHPDLDTMAYSGISGPGTTGYLPVLFKNYYSWYSSYQTQETIGNSADVSVVYYPSGGKTFSLNPYGHQQVWMGAETSLPDGWQGSAKVSVTAGSGQVATAVTHGGPGGAQGYHGLKGGARDLIVPLIRKNVSGWDASLTVQNVGTANTQVTVRFYNSGGTEIGSPAQFAVQSGQAHMLYSELPGGVSSAWVHSNSADVVAVTNQGHTNGYSMGYSVP